MTSHILCDYKKGQNKLECLFLFNLRRLVSTKTYIASTPYTASFALSHFSCKNRVKTNSLTRVHMWNCYSSQDRRLSVKFAPTFIWGALSDERNRLLFTISAGPRQRSRCRVRILCDSRPHFTVLLLQLSSLQLLATDHVETPRSQQYLYCFASIRCCGNMFT
jgi:hypothetical protein